MDFFCDIILRRILKRSNVFVVDAAIVCFLKLLLLLLPVVFLSDGK
jgi:hypothetical protein